MRYEIIANGTTANTTFRPYFGDIVEMTLTDGTTVEGKIGRVSENGRTFHIMTPGHKIDTAVHRDAVQNLTLIRFHTFAIDALVTLEDGTRVQRTIRRNIHETRLDAVVADLEAEPHLDRVRAYAEAF